MKRRDYLSPLARPLTVVVERGFTISGEVGLGAETDFEVEKVEW